MKGVQGKAINNEFVQEVEVKTGGYQAEYGRALGGVINVITKSGGNAFHGDAFVYYDSASHRAAADLLKPGATRRSAECASPTTPAPTTASTSADIIVQDRLWFFGAYNRTDLPAAVSRYVSSDLVPDHDAVPDRQDGQPLFGEADLERCASARRSSARVFADPSSNSGAAGRTRGRLHSASLRSPTRTRARGRPIAPSARADFGLRGSSRSSVPLRSSRSRLRATRTGIEFDSIGARPGRCARRT